MNAIRISIERYNTIRIQELPCTGKRFLGRFTLCADYELQAGGCDFLAENLVLGALGLGLEQDEPFEAPVSFADAVEAIRVQWAKASVQLPCPCRVESINAQEVPPAGYTPLALSTPTFWLCAEWAHFTASNPERDDYDQPDPHFTNVVSKSAAGARKLFKLLSKQPRKFVDLEDFTAFLTANKIAYRYQFSVWS